MHGQGSVLLVLDAPRSDLVDRLREGSAAVTEATPGEAAAALASTHVDVLVAPFTALAAGLHGEALARRPRPDIVVVSPPDRLADAVALLRSGANDVLAEPLDAEGLASAVGLAVERRTAAAAAELGLETARASASPRLSGSVVHEIANRVAVLVSALSAIESALSQMGSVEQLLAPGADPHAVAAWWQEDGRAAVADARDATKEASEVTDRLKTLARDLRAVLGPHLAAPAVFDVGDAIAIALRLARPVLASVARVEVSVPAGAAAFGSPGALARAALELLLLSADAFMEAGARAGHVRVAYRAEPEWAVIELENDAPSAADRARANAPRQAGAQAAVALASDLAQRQGGSFAARRPPAGSGHLFELRLPAARRRA